METHTHPPPSFLAAANHSPPEVMASQEGKQETREEKVKCSRQKGSLTKRGKDVL